MLERDLFLRGLEINWNTIPPGSYLYGIPALRSLRALSFRERVTFFVGENASGKTTLLEAIAVAYGFNAEGGTMNYRFSTWEGPSELSRALRLIKGCDRAKIGYFFRAESFFNLATKAEEYDRQNPWGPSFGDRSLHEQSHGESFLSFMESFRDGGLYLMDEPEAALSPQNQLALLLLMLRLRERGAQFIVASHSPILLGLPGAQLLSFDGDALREIGWEETESYQVTKLFLTRREKMLEELLR